MESSSQGMEELGRQWNNLQIEDGKQGILFEESEALHDEIDVLWCLVGRLLSDKPADFEGVKNVMAVL